MQYQSRKLAPLQTLLLRLCPVIFCLYVGVSLYLSFDYYITNDLNPIESLDHRNSMAATTERLPEKERNKTGMCSIAKNEEAYLDEWVDYHHALGFDNFYIYDNTDNFEMKQWGKLKGDHVEVIHYPGGAKQSSAYRDCSKRFAEGNKGNHTWAAFIDSDEFLVLRKHEHVSDFLEEHCAHGAIAVNWIVFHSNSWNLYSPAPVTKRFVYGELDKNSHIKSIARLDDIKGLNPFEEQYQHPHYVPLKDGFSTHDTNGRNISGPFNPNGPTNLAVIHHYSTKSAKEYVQKRSRGRADTEASVEAVIRGATDTYKATLAGEDIPLDIKIMSSMNLTFDDTAWTTLKKNVPSYAFFDEIGLIEEGPL